MRETAKDDLLRNLATMLIAKTVKKEIVEQALELLCTNFSFDIAITYEIDQCNILNLQEEWNETDYEVPKSFGINQFSTGCRVVLSRQTIYSVSENQEQDLISEELFDKFPGSSLLISSLTDDKERICGLIVFISKNEKKNFTSKESLDLEIMLSMLGKYISLRMYQSKVVFARKSLERVLDNTGIDIYVNDFETHDILYVNKSMAAPYGGVSEFVGQKCWKVLFPGQTGPCDFCPQKNIIDESGIPTRVYTWDYQRPFDGSWFRVFSAAFRWIDGRMAHVVSSANITDNKKNEELIHYMAHYDALTKLPNRRMLVKECEKRINQANAEDQAFILFFDIDRFKAINDTFGHDAGDEFLIKLGEFFNSIPLLKDAIYRNGGDEFVAIINGSVTKDNIRSLVRFIHDRFKNCWELEKGKIYCNASVGVACYPEDGDTAEILLNIADQAMYKVKKAGGGSICFGYQLHE